VNPTLDDGLAERPAFVQQVGLPAEGVERPWPHTICQRTAGRAWLAHTAVAEEIGHNEDTTIKEGEVYADARKR
jgi:hypothetical protein